jgi:hypothetical protein
VDLLQTIIERWGFPVGFAVWLMMGVTRDLREIRALVHKQVVLNAVILKTLDIPEAAMLDVGAPKEDKAGT